MSLSKEQCDAFMAHMETPEFAESLKTFWAKEQAKKDKQNSQADRLYNLIKDDFDSFMNKVCNKSWEYGCREHIKYRLFNYAQRHGTPIDLKEDWPTESFILDGWIISITFGQGSFIWFKKHE